MLDCIEIQLRHTPFHYITLRCIFPLTSHRNACHWNALHHNESCQIVNCTSQHESLHCMALDCTAPRHVMLRWITILKLNYIALLYRECVSLANSTSHDFWLPCITLYCITVGAIALHCIAWHWHHCRASCRKAWHWTALHHITFMLHGITFQWVDYITSHHDASHCYALHDIAIHSFSLSRRIISL